MTLSRRSSRIYMDDYDVQGAINALGKKADETEPPMSDTYRGAAAALAVVEIHEFLNTQADFMTAFEAYVGAGGSDRREI